MRRLIVIAWVCLSGSLAIAAPPRYSRPARQAPMPPAMAAAEALWTAATQEPDAAAAVATWKAAARAFDAVAASTNHAHPVRAEAAYAAVLSWKNALAADPTIRPTPQHDPDDDGPPRPRPLADDDAALVTALGRYLALVPDAPEIAELRFVRANVLRRYDRIDEALPDLIELIERHRQHEVAAYAINLLLDLLIRAERYDEMIAWVQLVRQDAAYLRGQPELAARLLQIEVQSLRKQAEQFERDGKQGGDREAYARCAAVYDQIVTLAPTDGRRDELLYNAGVCLEEGGDADGALARYRRIIDELPRSRIAQQALARSGHLTLRIGHVVDAAAAFARYARRYPAEPDAHAAMLDAIGRRAALGQTDLAADDARWFVKTFGAKRRGDAALALAIVVAAHLERGERGAARQLATMLVRIGPDQGALAWQAACPIATADGLCLQRGRARRDPALARAALASLASSPRGEARLVIATAALEDVLAARRVDDAQAERVATAYAAIVAAAAADPDAAIIAHAHLGALARHRQQPAAARAAFTACAELAIASARPGRLALCDDGLRQLGAAPAILGEHLPGFATTPLRPDLEPAHR